MEPNPNFGYIPQVTVFEYKGRTKARYWLNYRLPNGKRVRRPCSDSKPHAHKLARIKQGQLMNGGYDEKDRELLGRFLKDNQKLTIDEAFEYYLQISTEVKNSRTLRNDSSTLKQLAVFFKGRKLTYLDEITPLDCTLLLSQLRSKGRSDSTIKNYRVAVSKVFNCLNRMKLVKLENPMTAVAVRKNQNLARKRIPNETEIKKLLEYAEQRDRDRSNESPMKAIIRFALLTGARQGEILHAERSDFDLIKGLWYIAQKPNCPAKEGLGWSPKWGKSRTVALFPEVVDLLISLPRYQTVGTVVNPSGAEIEMPAEFIFPKRQVRIEPGCPMELSSGHAKCVKCQHQSDRELCGFRKVIFSRCDSVKTAWKNICESAGIKDLQFKDLRRYFNKRVLQDRLGFSLQEAGWYIGNSKTVNEEHYSPISPDLIAYKLAKRENTSLLETEQTEFLN